MHHQTARCFISLVMASGPEAGEEGPFNYSSLQGRIMMFKLLPELASGHGSTLALPLDSAEAPAAPLRKRASESVCATVCLKPRAGPLKRFWRNASQLEQTTVTTVTTGSYFLINVRVLDARAVDSHPNSGVTRRDPTNLKTNSDQGHWHRGGVGWTKCQWHQPTTGPPTTEPTTNKASAACALKPPTTQLGRPVGCLH
jgi:hypothetical protein